MIAYGTYCIYLQPPFTIYHNNTMALNMLMWHEPGVNEYAEVLSKRDRSMV